MQKDKRCLFKTGKYFALCLGHHKNYAIMKCLRFLFFITVLTTFFSACNSNPADADIQQNVNDLFKKDLAGAALNATVDNGVATISGECVGGGCTADVVERVKKIKGVTGVQTNIIEKK